MPPTTTDAAHLAVAIARLEALAEDMVDMKSALRDLVGAVQKLAVIEERQSNSHAAVERAFGELAKHETRISSLEQAQPIHKQTSTMVTQVVTVVITSVCTALVALVLSAKPQMPADRPRQAITEATRP